MTTRKTLLAAVAATLLAGPAVAQVPIASLNSRGITIQGTVTEVFGNRVILQDQSGRTLVDLGPPHHSSLRLAPGERITVAGEPRENGFHARVVTREDGTSVTIDRGPPPRADRAAPRPERRAEERGPGARAEAASLTPREVRRLSDRLAQAGYTEIGTFERKPRHIEVTARNPRGERVELHLDAEGNVYKERWLEARRGDRR